MNILENFQKKLNNFLNELTPEMLEEAIDEYEILFDNNERITLCNNNSLMLFHHNVIEYKVISNNIMINNNLLNHYEIGGSKWTSQQINPNLIPAA